MQWYKLSDGPCSVSLHDPWSFKDGLSPADVLRRRVGRHGGADRSMFRRQAMYADVRRCIQMAGRQLPAGPHAGCQRISSIKCHMSGSHSGSGTWRVWGRLEGSRKTARVSCASGEASRAARTADSSPRCASATRPPAVRPKRRRRRWARQVELVMARRHCCWGSAWAASGAWQSSSLK